MSVDHKRRCLRRLRYWGHVSGRGLTGSEGDTGCGAVVEEEGEAEEEDEA